MNKESRNNSYDANKYHLQAMMNNTRNILSRGLSNNSTKEQKSYSKERQPILRLSGPYIPKQKVLTHQNYYQLNKSADISYFLERPKENSFKSEEQQNNINIVYIGQIQALERRKNGRKNFYRKLKVDKEFKEEEGINIDPPKYNATAKRIDQINQNELQNQKQAESQPKVEQLHYQMVLMQQKCKKKTYN